MCPMVRLRSTARPVRRAPGEVQFGVAPGDGIVLAGLSEAESDLLLSLTDGTGTARDEVLSLRFAVPLPRVRELVAALRSHQLLVEAAPPEPSVRRRGPARLAVPGHGRVVLRVRQALCDVGCEVTDQPDPAAAAADLAVLCARDAIAPDLGAAWQAAGIWQVPLVLHGDTVTIGPLVRPGQSPCLRCLDLHRRDRDQAWPRILSQLASHTSELTGAVDCPQSQVALIAGLATMVTQEALTSPAPTLGMSWDLCLPRLEVRTRQWSVHPDCRCTLGRHATA